MSTWYVTGVSYSRWGGSTYYEEWAWRVYVDGEYMWAKVKPQEKA